MDNYMKKLILSFVLSIFTGYITANNFVQQIQQYGDNGDFHRMDSIYSLAKQQVNYKKRPSCRSRDTYNLCYLPQFETRL